MTELDDTVPGDGADSEAENPVPLESDPADWQEQHADVPDPDPDERR